MILFPINIYSNLILTFYYVKQKDMNLKEINDESKGSKVFQCMSGRISDLKIRIFNHRLQMRFYFIFDFDESQCNVSLSLDTSLSNIWNIFT